MGAVALMGPGSDAEWDWLPTELGCCCPESESNTHNANVSARPTYDEFRVLQDPLATGMRVCAIVGQDLSPQGQGRDALVLGAAAPLGWASREHGQLCPGYR